MILALSPSPSLDATIEVPELTPGAIVRPTRVTRVAGGKALNAARVAVALGADVHAIVALGGPSGDWIASILESDGVAATRVTIEAATRMCAAIVVGEGSTESTDIYEPPATLSPAEWESLAEATRDAVAALAPGYVALSGSLPPGIEPTAMAALLADLDARTVVDGSGPGLRATIASANLVKINRAEASEVAGSEFASAAAAAAGLFDTFGVDAIVTDGIRGAAAYVGGESVTIPAPSVYGTFPAGSGDAFLGGFLAAADRGASLELAMQEASTASIRNALVPGQGILAPVLATG